MSRQPTKECFWIGVTGFVLGFATAIMIVILFITVAVNYHQQNPRQTVLAAPPMVEITQP